MVGLDPGSPYVVLHTHGSPVPEVTESYPAEPASVPRARGAVVQLAAAAGADEERVDSIRLAVSEALTNAVLHAYQAAPGLVHVRARAADGCLSVVVADEGSGLRPRIARRGMGLGLALIAEAAQELAILKRPQGGTELRMRFVL